MMRFSNVQELLDLTVIDPALCAVDTTKDACFADHAFHVAGLLERLGYGGDVELVAVAMAVGIAAEHDSREPHGWTGISATRAGLMTGLAAVDAATALALLLELGVVETHAASRVFGPVYRYPEAS